MGNPRKPDPIGRAAHVAARIGAVRRRTVELAAPLTAEDAMVQSMPDASPAKWHLGHTTWFFETFVLARAERDFRAFHPRYGYLFNSYYEAAGPRQPRPSRGLLSRPPLEEVLRYRAEVDARLAAAFGAGLAPDLVDVAELGAAHEEQHQELLLTDVKHAFASSPLRPAYGPLPPAPARPAPALAFVPREGGVVEIGASGPGFAFDNERPRHRTWLEPHALASRPATCGEWLAFMADGGYRRAELWLAEGWDAVRANGWEAPLYWERDGAGWAVYTLGGMRAVADAEPVQHVSFHEADAFARWAGARLPTEPEWEVAAAAAGAGEGHFADAGRLQPDAAPARPGLVQLAGDVWEWTRSAYGPYPGFRPLSGALGEYNGKFMVSQLVLRGGSCLTPAGHVRPSYRNFFPPGARWQSSGVRLARDA